MTIGVSDVSCARVLSWKIMRIVEEEETTMSHNQSSKKHLRRIVEEHQHSVDFRVSRKESWSCYQV